MTYSVHKAIGAAAIIWVSATLASCGEYELVASEARSLLVPQFTRSEVFGFLAGLGTTFASLPSLVQMCRQRSSAGMNPTMAAMTGCSQLLWIYYGFLIASRPVILWNVVSLLMNFLFVYAYMHFVRLEKQGR